MSNNDDPYGHRPPHGPPPGHQQGHQQGQQDGQGPYQQPPNDWGAPQQGYGPPPGYDQQGGGPMMHQPPGQGGKPQLEGNDILAIALSFFFPGVGQIILGQTTKGIVMIAVTFFTCGMLGLIPIAAVLDAYTVAMAKKQRAVGEWEFFPDFNKMLGSG
ncbi:MAG: hypothetical protein H0U74_04420 [Bradymonadaceae bacterium]|nr:hypothetical protein [Lujinxingiaceae bacterium]